MARIKYYYDTESCRYERIRVSTWDIILNALGFVAVVFMMALGVTFIYIKYFESPEEASLRKENDELRLHYELLGKELDYTNNVLSTLQGRDDDIYRVVLGAEPVPEDVRKAGFGGADRYRELLKSDLQSEDLIVNNYKKIDQLKKQMYVQTKSYDQIIELANDKEKMLASLPAILPVSKHDYRRLSSGFGSRIHPILKIRRPHNGVDFSLPKGSPVYATGNGKVSLTKSRKISGYGNQIDIDHGYGYKTRYAHLKEILVKQGETIKRGQLIAYSGNSGASTAPHLHYEVHVNRKPVNPVHYFNQNISPEEYDEVLKLAAEENQSFGSY